MSLSIITPFHGPPGTRKKQMLKLINSINEQKFDTWKNPIKEWFVIGDDITGWIQSLEVPWCFKYASTGNVKNISFKRNVGLERATGDWILMIDSDQYFASDYFIRDILKAVTEIGYGIGLIQERFSHEGFYLRRSYHKLRQLYWDKSMHGIPRLYSKDLIKLTRYDPEKLHGEDLEFYKQVSQYGTIPYVRIVTDDLVHDEDFHFWENMRKTHKAKKQEGIQPNELHFRLSLGEIMGGIPKFYLPGALLILGLRAMARRI